MALAGAWTPWVGRKKGINPWTERIAEDPGRQKWQSWVRVLSRLPFRGNSTPGRALASVCPLSPRRRRGLSEPGRCSQKLDWGALSP